MRFFSNVGSPKAVNECFEAIAVVLPHAIDLINGLPGNEHSHVEESQSKPSSQNHQMASHRHICPNKTGTGTDDDRNSTFPMISVDSAHKIILNQIHKIEFSHRDFVSPINIPEFRASIKDGYAVKANGSCKGHKKVISSISAGDDVVHDDFDGNFCFKINTGAIVPDAANAVVQIEDTKLIKTENGIEKEIEILIEPMPELDIR